MENIDESCDLMRPSSTTMDWDTDATNVLGVATLHVKGFVSCDTPLTRTADTTGLLAKVKSHRGEPSLTPKGRIQHEVDNMDVSTVNVFVQKPHFEKFLFPTIRFFSIYATLPEPGTCSIVQLDRDDPRCPATKVERVVSHPVGQGCMKQSGVMVFKANKQREKLGSSSWNLYWGARFKDEKSFSSLSPFQRVNHFCATWLLGNKVSLAKQIRLHGSKAKESKGKFNFVPLSYNIPADLKILASDAKNGHIFIAKPPASACGRGIFLFRGKVPSCISDLGKPTQAASTTTQDTRKAQAAAAENSEDDDETPTPAEDYMVQRYLPNPFLINGYKVDFRVYVACTGFDPLRAYVFNDGLVRFASEPYPSDLSTANLDNIFAHLTNYSINKKSESYVKTNNADDDGSGSKWTFHALKRHFESNDLDWEGTWKNICDVIVKTLIACEDDICSKINQSCKFRSSCFELYGFDIMLDSSLKAYLVEVNVMPSLACGSALDKHIKGHMVADLLNLTGIPLVTKPASPNTAAHRDPEEKAMCNLPFKSVRNSKVDVSNFREYLGKHATPDDKHVLRENEEELSRAGGFARVFPTATSLSEYSQLFVNKKHYNLLLANWESLKSTLSDAEKVDVVRWLNDECSFPGTQVEKPKPRVSIRPPTLSTSRLTKGRLSAAPRSVREKVQVPSRQATAPIHVNTFTFLEVKK